MLNSAATAVFIGTSNLYSELNTHTPGPPVRRSARIRRVHLCLPETIPTTVRWSAYLPERQVSEQSAKRPVRSSQVVAGFGDMNDDANAERAGVELARRTRAAQGLPRYVEDPSALERMAGLFDE